MSTIEEQLNKLREETLASLKKISTENEKEMQNLRVSVLGKKGSLTEILKRNERRLCRYASDYREACQ